VSQGLCPLLCGTLHPLAYGPFSYPQGLGYLRLFPASLFQLSKARKRLPSRQLVASLDIVFSIVGFVIPMSLDLYAEICNAGPSAAARQCQDLIATRCEGYLICSYRTPMVHPCSMLNVLH
jgi:hypothetical protein